MDGLRPPGDPTERGQGDDNQPGGHPAAVLQASGLADLATENMRLCSQNLLYLSLHGSPEASNSEEFESTQKEAYKNCKALRK